MSLSPCSNTSMAITPSDPPEILAERTVDGVTVRLVNYGFGPRWICACPEFLEVRPNTYRAYCRHTRAAEKRITH